MTKRPGKDPQMAIASPSPLAVFHLSERVEGLQLIDVAGALGAGGVTRWSSLLHGAIDDGATGITVDLRSCTGIDATCLTVLLAAATSLRTLGGTGVSLVTFPGSPVARRVGAIDELPAYDSAAKALDSLRAA